MNTKKKSTSRIMLDYLFRFKFYIFLAVLASIPVSIISASPAYIVQKLLDKVLIAGNNNYLLIIVVGLPILFLLKGIFYFIQNYLMAYVGQKLIISIRYDVFSHLQKVSLSFFSKKTTGQLISRMTNDVNMVQAMVKGSMTILNDIISLICLFGYIFYLHWKLTLLVFVVLPFIGGIVRKFSKKIRRVGHDMQEKMADVTSVMHEAISGVQITRAFTMEEHEIERFHNKDRESMKAQLRGVRVQSTVLPVVEFMNTMGLAIVMFYGGQIVINGELTTGQLIGFLAGLGMTFSPIKRLTNINSVIQQSLAAADRIFSLMDEDIEEGEEDKNIEIDDLKGSVEFEDVFFSYDDKYDVIRGLDLKVRPGEIVAFVGPSGGGKSTIVSLIPRFYTPYKGEIRVDGKNINDINIKSLRKHMAIVPQDTILFTGTIKENISYGNPEATDEEIIEAAKMANAHNFISDFRKGYETQVGERGAMLSGGQKQRIAIARALLRNAKILILDEATSALDSESEALVQDALENLMEEKTTFVIAHRLSTIRKADKICVIDDGRIVQLGTHDQLMEKGGEYRQIYNAQFYFLDEASGE
ncbi:MAG: ABC transporter ATP-binding protein [Candidatus Muiribacterium halophilum]|uniref:ABC transporter ATP-binding protein n=1 Tax=Muiribacterium halophilum TaxID=2053465 RepID=A0A2N5ZBQ1_MUIH1|nr:MAG: ABC transporter ATP-binding protein [Candidatus Muirbacterium halophilum]